MSQQFPLQSLLDLSNLRLEESTRRLGELVGDQRQAGERLELLIRYRDEYRSRFSSAAQAGLGPNEWQNYRQFLNRLDTAVEQARAMVSQSVERADAGREDWIAKRGKVKAFDTLAVRHVQRAAYREQKQEQKLSDEHGARRHGESKDED